MGGTVLPKPGAGGRGDQWRARACQRVKPSKPIRPGDEIAITRGSYRWQVTVDGLAVRRGSASEACTLYTEQADSLRQREMLQAESRLSAPAPTRRPDKRQRRKIIRFVNLRDQ
jgi:ribosome-associated heat shock protein Hsp15